MDASLVDGAKEEEGAAGGRQPASAGAVQGALKTTADGGAAEMGASLVDGANKEEGAAGKRQHTELGNCKTGELAEQCTELQNCETGKLAEQRTELRNCKTVKLTQRHEAGMSVGPSVKAKRSGKGGRPHEQVALLEGVHKVWQRPEPHNKWRLGCGCDRSTSHGCRWMMWSMGGFIRGTPGRRTARCHVG